METPLVDIILTCSIEQAPELCKEVSKHFDNSLKGNNKEIERTVTWSRAEFGKDNQESMVIEEENPILTTTTQQLPGITTYKKSPQPKLEAKTPRE